MLEQRDRVLTTDAARQALARRCPERYAELSADGRPGGARQTPPGRSSSTTSTAAGRTTSPRWPAIREGIHLRALGRGLNPLSEFHREAATLFTRLLPDVEERSAETFRTVPITDSGADLEAVGLKRPTATWTYLVQDNPFGTDIDRALRGVGRLLRGSRR